MDIIQNYNMVYCNVHFLQVMPILPSEVSCFESGEICVQGYMVKKNVALVLEAIFQKHGDIAAECIFKTHSARASFLEIICEIVWRIQTNDFTAQVSEMEEIESQLSVAEAG